jgi:hypothetical protein
MKRIEGIGVRHLTFMSEIAAGKCPFLAPTKNNRELAKIAPFSEPNVLQATNSGMIQVRKAGSILSPNVTATASDDWISVTDSTAK